MTEKVATTRPLFTKMMDYDAKDDDLEDSQPFHDTREAIGRQCYL